MLHKKGSKVGAPAMAILRQWSPAYGSTCTMGCWSPCVVPRATGGRALCALRLPWLPGTGTAGLAPAGAAAAVPLMPPCNARAGGGASLGCDAMGEAAAGALLRPP